MSFRQAFILIPVLFLLVIGHGTRAQVLLDDNILEYDSVAERILLKKEYSGGIIMHNLGFGGNFRLGRNKTYFNSRIIEIEVVSMKHPKQVRMVTYYPNAKPFVYGKLNHVYILRGGYGYKKLLNRKPYWGGIELRLLYLGGVSLALAKPVYLYFWDETYSFIKEERYDPENIYHSSEYIIGRSSFLSGFDKMRIYPGVYAQFGLNFEFGKLNSKIRAIEGGVYLEYFPIPVPIMAFNPEQRFFPTIYLNFHLGKRYN